MRVKIVLFLTLALAADAARANAGLTSAGVTSSDAPQPEEPTLAQVAPVPGAANTVAPGGAVAATAGNAGVNAAGGVNGGGNTTAAATVAAPKISAPPPPPDPATLPVSVIRPLNKNGSAVQSPATVSETTTLPRAPAPDRPENGVREAARAPVPIAAQPTPLRRAPTTALRTEAPARSASEPAAAETPPDASASSFIFYSGSGLAGVILLLSIGSFLRARGAEPILPRADASRQKT